MPRTIPELRERLSVLAIELGCPELEEIARDMRRRPAVRKARPRSPTVTEDMAERIRAYAEAHPAANYMQIATAFNVSNGRVSEALAGKRDGGARG